MSRAGAVPSAGAADVPLLSPSITVDRIRRIFTPPAPMRLYNLGAIQQQQEQQQQEQQQQEQQEQQERDGAQPASVTPVHSERFAEMRLKFECGAGRGATTSAPPAPLLRRGSSRSCAGTPASSPSPPASSPSSPLSLTTLPIKVGCQALATAGQDVVPGADSSGAGPDAAHGRDDAGVRAVAARYPADPAPRAIPRKRGGPSDGGARRRATSIPRANGVVSASGAGDPRTTPIAARGLPARSRLNSGPISKRLSGFMQDDSSSDGDDDDGDADEAQGGRADEPARDPAAAAGHRDDAATGPPGAAGRGRPRSAGAEEGQVLGNSSSSTAMSSPDGSPVSKLGSIAECDLGASDCVGSPVFTEHGERLPSHHRHDRGGEERAATVEDRAAPGASADHGQRRTKEGVPVGVEARGSREREGREAALPQPHAEARGATPTTAGDLRHETPLHTATGAMPGEPPVTTTPAKAVTLAVTPAMTPAVTVTPTLTKTTTLIATSALNTNLTPSAAPAKTVPLLTTPVMTKSVTVIPITTLTMNSAISATAIITSTSTLTVGDVTQSTTVTPAGPAQASPVSQAVSTEHNHRYRGSGEAGRDDGCPRDATEETGVDGAGEEEEEPRFGGPSGTQCLEIPGLGEEPGEALMPGRRVHFSHKPIKVFATFSTERYERRNADVDPVRASAEMELETRMEALDVQQIALQKGPEGLGIAIVGIGATAGARPRAGAKQLGGIYVRALSPGGAAHAHGGICEMDQILAVDSTSLVGASQEVATRVLQSTGETVRLVIGREKGAHVVGSEGNSELSVKYKELLIRFAAVTNEVKALKKEVCEAEAAQAKGERQRYLLQTKLKEERRRGEAMETVMATKAEEAERRHRELLRRYRRAVALLAPALIREHGLTAGSHSEDGGGGGEDGGGAGEDGGGGGEDGGGGGELGGDGEDGGDGENGGDGANGTDAHQQQEQQQQEQQQEQQEQQESSTEENGNVTASQTGAQGPPEDGPRPPGPRPAPYISKGPLWRLGLDLQLELAAAALARRFLLVSSCGSGFLVCCHQLLLTLGVGAPPHVRSPPWSDLSCRGGGDVNPAGGTRPRRPPTPHGHSRRRGYARPRPLTVFVLETSRSTEHPPHACVTAVRFPYR
ncbi:uncharacterized protein LOC144724739 isoform X3 [Lampetra planeri]